MELIAHQIVILRAMKGVVKLAKLQIQLRQILENFKTKAILPIIRGVVKKLGDETGKFNLRNSNLTYYSSYLTVE